MKRTIFILFLMSLLGAFISCQSDEENETSSVTSRADVEWPDRVCLGLNSAHTYYFKDAAYRNNFSVAFFATFDSVFSADSAKRYHMSSVTDVITHFKDDKGNAQGIYSMVDLEHYGAVSIGYNYMLVLNLDLDKYCMTDIGGRTWIEANNINRLSEKDLKRLHVIVCVFDPSYRRGLVTYAARFSYWGEDKLYFGLSAYRYIYRPADYIDVLFDELIIPENE